MLKRLILVAVIVSFSSVGFAGPLWHCIANNKNEAVWNWYAPTEPAARKVVEKQCEPYNDRKACPIVCFPPRNYWRCLSHDIPTRPTQNDPKPTQGVWYWTSFSKQIAINGARDACRHNSPYGGCYVDENACTSSSGDKE